MLQDYLVKMGPNSVFGFNTVQYIPGMNPLCKWKASESPTLHTNLI